eukprot:TRINITY_DN9777_c0_g1_i2.p1 TRINITY_DN9777_c0_g1~~TRINITY_DN9777_c0_g1_i2.p1  ORF type:complete len:345 (-),score=45.25 TRINITY_DN9777_c0_g1_i2:224-1258(-)
MMTWMLFLITTSKFVIPLSDGITCIGWLDIFLFEPSKQSMPLAKLLETEGVFSTHMVILVGKVRILTSFTSSLLLKVLLAKVTIATSLGLETRCTDWDGLLPSLSTHLTGERSFSDWPLLDENYFEWEVVLQAAAHASSRSWNSGGHSGFAMAEIGAGPVAIWAMRSGVAYHRLAPLNSSCVLLAVEPAWADSAELLYEELDINLPPERCRVVAVPKILEEAGPGGLVNQLDRASMGAQKWDLVDMDCQGCELQVIREELRELASRVLRLHISTHTRAIHEEILSLLRAAGWFIDAEFTFLSISTIKGLGPFPCRDGHITAFPPCELLDPVDGLEGGLCKPKPG